MRKIKLSLLTGLLLFGAAGCAEMDISNPNNPEKSAVVSEGPEDLEALISGSWKSWWNATTSASGVNAMLSVGALQHAAGAANFGMVERSQFPRLPVGNDPADAFAGNYQYTWDNLYKALAATSEALAAMGDTLVIGDATRTAKARAFAHFVQGLAHASLAVAYDQAFILPETYRYDANLLPSDQGLELSDHTQVLEAAFKSFDKAIAIAQANSFKITGRWMAEADVTSAQLIKMIHSYKARYRAELARTAAERASVDWAQVMADVDSGIQDGEDFVATMDYPVIWHSSSFYPNNYFGAWGKVPYFIYGMADTTGAYQEWMSTPILDRLQIVIASPDLRFPQGETVAEQAANQGLYIKYRPGGQANADRGTWRWSHYVNDYHGASDGGDSGPFAELTFNEMRLLKAEGLYRAGDLDGAADLINVTRVGTGGLPPVAAAYNPVAPNCVPRLPNGECGDLFEALKWEKRLETYYSSFGGWYFNSRGWGDLPVGSFLDLPVPAIDLLNFLLPVYTTGGRDGNRSAGPSIFDPQS